jgi:PAS domain S-box-containing protein
MRSADWQNTPLTFPLLLSGLLCGWVAYVGWRRRAVPGAVPFVVLMAALAGWALVNLVEKSLVNHDLRRAASAFVYLFIVTVPGAWLVFAARFSNQDRWLPRRLIPLLFLDPALTLALAFTNPYHCLIHAATEMKTDGPYAVMAITHGPFFYVNTAYTYLVFAAGAALLVAGVARQPGRSVGRLVILLGAMLVPLLGNIAYVFHLQPHRLTDLTPVYFAVPGLASAWLLFRVRVFDVLPIARDFVLDCLGDAVFVLDTRFRILDANLAARALVPGARPVRKRPLADALPELGRYLPTRPAAEGSATEIQLGSAGSERFWDMHVLPLVDLEATIGALVRLTDVTERRRSAEARSRLAAIVESSEDAIIGQTLDGVIVSWNPGAERLYGYSAEEVRGRPFAILFPPDLPDELPEILERLRRGKRIESSEFVHVRKDGKRVDVALSLSPIKDASGAVTGASAIGRDVTERRRLEEELRRQAQQLTAADRRKDEFLAMLAHELRNPLAPLRNALQIMKMSEAAGPLVESARQMMERQVQQLVRLVDDLLDVSRITRGKIQLRKEPVELATVVAHAVETSRALLEARKHEVTVSLPPEPLWLEADLTRLAQVFANLLNNAAKYTEEGGHICLTAERRGDDVVLRVNDTGTGMTQEMLTLAFDLFAQADRSLDRSQGGLGIGLTLVRSLVHLHGGAVQAFSDGPGKGSEFVVRLPALGQTRPAGRIPEERNGPWPSRRILVVDDNEDAAESLAQFLRMKGQEVRTAYRGPAALEAAGAFLPEVVLLDIGMPGMDGYEVARRLRRESGLEKILLVALTGYGREEDRRRSREAAIDHHLVKPVDPEALGTLLAHPGPLVRGSGTN